MLPDFICLGAQRTATTWLHNCLKEHPEVSTPGKEMHFFNAFYDKGWDWYVSQFEEKSGIKAYGELTPDYLHSEEALLRIRQRLPNIKLFVILRQPFDRSVSAYRLFKAERFQNLDMLGAFRENPYLVNQSLYSEAVNRLLQEFDREQLLFLQYDEVCADPASFLKKVYQFIGVDSDFLPSSINSTYNKVIYPQAQELLTKLHLSFIVDMVSTSFIGNIIRRNYKEKSTKNTKKLTYSEFSEFLPIYQKDLTQLEKLLDLDLSKWKKQLNEQLT